MPFDRAIPLLGVGATETLAHVQSNDCRTVCDSKARDDFKRPIMGNWLNKLWHIHSGMLIIP